MPVLVTFGADDETFLGDGWAGRETIGGDDVRWATGMDANVFLPFNSALPHQVRMRIMPFEARGLPPQRAFYLAALPDVGQETLDLHCLARFEKLMRRDVVHVAPDRAVVRDDRMRANGFEDHLR